MTAGTSTPEETDRVLLRSAVAGDAAAVASLYDRHAGALYSLACWVLDDDRRAEEAVVDAVVAACGGSDGTVSATAGGSRRSVRHVLARATYQRCASAARLPAEVRSRACVALCVHGDHTFAEATALTGTTGVPLARMLQGAAEEHGLARSA